MSSKILCSRSLPADFHVLYAKVTSTVQVNLFKSPSEGLRGLEWDTLLLVTSQKRLRVDASTGGKLGIWKFSRDLFEFYYIVFAVLLRCFTREGAESGSRVGW